jgi:putative membrane protein
VGACTGEGRGLSEDSDPGRRTLLAVERTYLAWWRTGLTAYAVALATARVVPELSRSKVQWPYTVLGIGFALLGTACVVYGERRRRAGAFEDASPALTLGFTVGGVVLGLGLVVVLAIKP